LVDQEVWLKRLGRLEDLLKSLQNLGSTPLRTFLHDKGLQAQAERWLQLAIECCLDLANHLIADQAWHTPSSYRETFEILEQQLVLPAELAARMKKLASLRNVLVHMYLDIDYEIVFSVLQNELDDFRAYATAMVRFTEKRA
jgi:uncharacterized protein YutE (UPF0331/DUF86 family)